MSLKHDERSEEVMIEIFKCVGVRGLFMMKIYHQRMIQMIIRNMHYQLKFQRKS
jgi:hypothetical protein